MQKPQTYITFVEPPTNPETFKISRRPACLDLLSPVGPALRFKISRRPVGLELLSAACLTLHLRVSRHPDCLDFLGPACQTLHFRISVAQLAEDCIAQFA